MADPATLAIVAGATMGVSAVDKSISTYQQMREQARFASDSADIARRNADQAGAEGERNAEAALARSRSERRIQEDRFARAQARRRAGWAASGVDPAAGTALEVLGGAEFANALNLANIDWSGQEEAKSARYSGQSRWAAFMGQANQLSAQAKGLRKQALPAAFGSLLSGGSQALGVYAMAGGTFGSPDLMSPANRDLMLGNYTRTGSMAR